MPLSLNDYRSKLIKKILLSHSQTDVKRIIDTAVKSLEQYELNGHIIIRFTERMSDELALFNAMNKDSQQWSNIKWQGYILIKLKEN
jgi:hypothetical protein